MASKRALLAGIVLVTVGGVGGCSSAASPSERELCHQNYEFCADGSYYRSEHMCEHLRNVTVTGTDIYRIDRNHNGVACEPGEVSAAEEKQYQEYRELVRHNPDSGSDSYDYAPQGGPDCTKYCP